jgi:hypothetical protein
VTCLVIDYDETRRKFIIEFDVDGKHVKKYQARLNLIFKDFDSQESIHERRDLAIKLRRHTLFKLNAERLFIHELARKYDYIRMPQYLKDNIRDKVVLRLSKQN